MLQPLDICMNCPFKPVLYIEWMASGSHTLIQQEKIKLLDIQQAGVAQLV